MISTTLRPATELPESTVAAAAALGHAHAQQLWVNFLFGLLQYLDQVGGLFLVLVGKERVGDALVVTTASSADTVD